MFSRDEKHLFKITEGNLRGANAAAAQIYNLTWKQSDQRKMSTI